MLRYAGWGWLGLYKLGSWTQHQVLGEDCRLLNKDLLLLGTDGKATSENLSGRAKWHLVWSSNVIFGDQHSLGRVQGQTYMFIYMTCSICLFYMSLYEIFMQTHRSSGWRSFNAAFVEGRGFQENAIYLISCCNTQQVLITLLFQLIKMPLMLQWLGTHLPKLFDSHLFQKPASSVY